MWPPRDCSASRIGSTITREILPATLPLLITLLSLEMGIAVIVEAILSFVGLGVGRRQPAWGQMIADARQYIYESPWNLLLADPGDLLRRCSASICSATACAARSTCA